MFYLTAFTIPDPPPGEQYVAVGIADLGDVEDAEERLKRKCLQKLLKR